jgi:alkylation response protein AidB-like acyl-CoA dehydrogenase
MPTTVKDLLLVAPVAAPTVTPAAATDLVEKPDAPIFDVRNGTEVAAGCKVKRALARHLFGKALADHQMTHSKLADMAAAINASALLVYRAAWARDVQGQRITREAAMAKLYATAAAQRVIDDAVQIFGGLGVKSGMIVESLYREIRAPRIYEGASEVHKLIIAREALVPRNQPGSGPR